MAADSHLHVPSERKHPRFTGSIRLQPVSDQPDDVRTLQHISRVTFADTFSQITAPDDMKAFLTSAYATDTLTEQIHNPNSRFWFLLADGKIAGYLKLNVGDAQSDPSMKTTDSLEVERLYILPDFKHRGLGTDLMKFSEREAIRLHKSHMWLGVWEGNIPAQKLYESQGFHIVGSHVYQVGSDPQRDLLMRRDVSLTDTPSTASHPK
jgi:ribosomal protein S18 acetylase RimI-like enzyme